jgi:hypothetical protein
VDTCRGHTDAPGNILGGARSRERFVNHLPMFSAREARVGLHPGADFFLAQMTGGTRHSASHSVGLLSLTHSFLAYHTEREYVHLCTQPLRCSTIEKTDV